MGITLTNTVNLLQDLHAAIPGVEWSPHLDDYPRGELARSDLPCILTIPGPGTMNNRFGIGCRSEEREYQIMVMVADTGPSVQTEFFPEVARLIDELHELYNGNSVGNASNSDLHVEVSGENAPDDTGIDDEVSHADTRYYGFQLTVRIWRKAST